MSDNNLSLATMFFFVLKSDFLPCNFCDPKSIKKICLASYIPLTLSQASASNEEVH